MIFDVFLSKNWDLNCFISYFSRIDPSSRIASEVFLKIQADQDKNKYEEAFLNFFTCSQNRINNIISMGTYKPSRSIICTPVVILWKSRSNLSSDLRFHEDIF